MRALKEEAVSRLLDIFEGDIQAAHMALNNYAKEHHRDQHTNKTTLPYAQNEIIVSIQNLSKEYVLGKRSIQALKDVSFDIYRGEFIAITGASGSGKSTLLQIIGCLDRPTKGQVVIANKDIATLSDASLSKLRQNTVGFIFQSFYLQPFLSLSDNVAVPAMFKGSNISSITDKTALLLRQVGLADRASHFPKELSGGQIQRAAIARSLMNNPSIVLADEPTGNLDSNNSQSILDLFKTIRSQLGTTVVVVTHNAAIAQHADRIIELKDGAIL